MVASVFVANWGGAGREMEVAEAVREGRWGDISFAGIM
jgi:hypothetical protein